MSRVLLIMLDESWVRQDAAGDPPLRFEGCNERWRLRQMEGGCVIGGDSAMRGGDVIRDWPHNNNRRRSQWTGGQRSTGNTTTSHCRLEVRGGECAYSQQLEVIMPNI